MSGYSTRAVADLTGYSVSTILKRVHSGEIRASRLPGGRSHWRVAEADVARLAEALSISLQPGIHAEA